VSWILIAYLYGGTIAFPAPFRTEQACRAAGENLKAEYHQERRGDTGYARYICMRRTDA